MNLQRTIILLAWMFGITPLFALNLHFEPYTDAELALVRKTMATAGVSNGNIRVTLSALETEDIGLVTILVDGKVMVEQLASYWVSFTRPELTIVDVDRNGLLDVILSVYHGGQGMMLGDDLMIFSQYEKGRFARFILPAERFSYEDVCDLNGDRRLEIITCVLVRVNDHSWWTYRAWNIRGNKLIEADPRLNFPRAVSLLETNHRWRDGKRIQEILRKYPRFHAAAVNVAGRVPMPVHYRSDPTLKEDPQSKD